MQSQIEPTGYYSLEERKSTGAHYTPSLLADFVAKQIVSAWEKDSNKEELTRVLDPASGDGELLHALLNELNVKNQSNLYAQGFDTDAKAVSMATSRIRSIFPETILSIKEENFLEFV